MTDSIVELYQALNFAIKKDDFEKVLSISNKIYLNYPSEEKALHCKIVALINLTKFEDAWQVINKSRDKSKPFPFCFEKVYCEYRLNRFKDALVTIEQYLQSKEVKDATKFLELKAQILYRLEQFDDAFELYLSIIKDSTDEFTQEREANLAAVNAASCLFNANSLYNTKNFTSDTYEVCFNNALSLTANGKLDESLQMLNRAKELCKESFDEDTAEDELAPCSVQLAYVYQLMSRHTDANDIYQKLLKSRPQDNALVAVISNNVVCINRDQNIFDSKKRMKVAAADNLKFKLFAKQKNTIYLNHCLLQHISNQGDACKKSSLAHLKDDSRNVRAVLVYTAQLLKEKNYVEAVRFLQKFCFDLEQVGDCQESIVKCRFALAHILLHQNSLSQCMEQLMLLPQDVLYSDKMVSSVLTLYACMENRESACQFLDDAAKWYKNLGDKKKHSQLVLRSARLHESCGFYKKAASLYNQMLVAFPGDQKLIACLVNAYVHFDSSKAEETSRQLKTSGVVKKMPEVPLDQLENCFSLGSRYTKKVTPKVAQETRDDDVIAKRRHKKKKGKLPNNCYPTVVPDPERWLPRRERSYYRGKKKDRRTGKLARGNQGSSAAAGNLDFGAKTNAIPSESPSTSPKPEPAADAPSASKPTQQNKSFGSKQNKRKKNKGRW